MIAYFTTFDSATSLFENGSQFGLTPDEYQWYECGFFLFKQSLTIGGLG